MAISQILCVLQISGFKTISNIKQILSAHSSQQPNYKEIIKNIDSADKSAKEYDVSKPINSVMYLARRERFSAPGIRLEKHSKGYLEFMRSNPEKKDF